MSPAEARAHGVRLQVLAKLRQIESLFTDLQRVRSQTADYLAQEKGMMAAGQLGLFGQLLNTVCELTDEAFHLMPATAQQEVMRCLQAKD